MQLERGLEIHHDGDLPARSGMGSSSSFTVGLLYALYALMGVMPSKNQLAKESIHIEQNLIKETVGSQDQVTAAYGGLNHILFKPNGDISVRPVTVPQERLEELNSHLMLFYTGIMRTASDVAKTYIEDLESKSQHLSAMKDMVEEAISILCSNRASAISESCSTGPGCSSGISAPKCPMASWMTSMRGPKNAGPLAVRLPGRGGGGFLLLFVPPSAQERIRKALEELIYVPFKLESSGSQIIFYEPSQEDYSILDRERATGSIRPFQGSQPSVASKETG